MTSRRFSVLCLLTSVLCLAGCTIWPSSWRLGQTPLEKVAGKEAVVAQANGALLRQSQRDLHQATTTLAAAPDSRPVAVTRGLLADALASLDQAIGAPPADQEMAWRDFAGRLISENADTRAAAGRERADQQRATAALSAKAAHAVAAAWQSKQQALAYAADREDLADFGAKLKLGFFALIGLLVLGTVLSFAARFVPALGLAAKVVNSVVAPALTYVAQRAETGLTRVGAALAEVRTALPAAAQQITQIFDAYTDADHQTAIAAGATAAGGPPPPA